MNGEGGKKQEKSKNKDPKKKTNCVHIYMHTLYNIILHSSFFFFCFFVFAPFCLFPKLPLTKSPSVSVLSCLLLLFFVVVFCLHHVYKKELNCWDENECLILGTWRFFGILGLLVLGIGSSRFKFRNLRC
mgnify:CR=1 FL=1